MSMRVLTALPLLLLASASCTQDPAGDLPPLPEVEFDEQRAWADLVYIVEEIGTRRIGTKGAVATREYIRKQLEGTGFTVEFDEFTCTPPAEARRKGEIQGANVIARRAGTEPGEIWIASHYDTYDLPGFVGANDSGSSSAVLIELARQLGGEGPRQGPGLVFCWFDGEERFTPVPWDDTTNSTFGSRHVVDRKTKDGTLKDIQALILLDLCGDKQLRLMVENMSASWLQDIFRTTARRIGDTTLLAPGETIKDDHMPFVRAGVPAIDLIDFHFGPGNRYWHTKEDTLDKCSAESLKRTGLLVLSALPAVEARNN